MRTANTTSHFTARSSPKVKVNVRMKEQMKGNQIAIRMLVGCDVAIAFTVVMTALECSPLRNALSDLAPIYALVLAVALPISLVVVERTRIPIKCLSRGQKAFVVGSIIAAMTFWLLVSAALVSIVVFFIKNNGQPVWLD